MYKFVHFKCKRFANVKKKATFWSSQALSTDIGILHSSSGCPDHHLHIQIC